MILARKGLAVFPVDPVVRRPVTAHGHLEATTDEDVIKAWWKEYPAAEPGVHAGRSGVVILDIDRKNGKDGDESLMDAWLEAPESFSYATPSGGTHIYYRAPENVRLSGVSGYDGMEGVDRRGGSSYAVFWGTEADAEAFRLPDLADAPEWFLKPSKRELADGFEGDLEEWFDSLIQGEPNVLVRRAMDRIPDDLTHSEMVEMQYNAVRLGAEGNPGVDELLNRLRDAWLSRPPEGHTTPQSDWEFKFDDALRSGIQNYGATVERIAELPPYDVTALPVTVKLDYLAGEPGDKIDFSKALGNLVASGASDDRIASTLWNAPVTSKLAREWGIDFVYKRIEDARSRPEPTRDNPALDDTALDAPTTSLLTPAEREGLALRPTFVDRYVEQAKKVGWANESYSIHAAWSVLSMAGAFHGFIPISATHKMGVNLWHITLGYSGTGKSVALKFRDEVLRGLFEGDNPDAGYDVGSDSSPQGLHLALLHRDRQATLLGADEATRFFKSLAKSDWMSSLDNTLAHWYEGRVDPSNKISLKEMRGQSALTSFHIHMFATPDEFLSTVNRDMFKSGFLARMTWFVGDPPVVTDDRFTMRQQVDVVDFEDSGAEVKAIVRDLHSIKERFPTATPILTTDEALARMSDAHKHMYRSMEGKENWDIIEPSITRLSEALRKCAALNAMYRGSSTADIWDALAAIKSVEIWFQNLIGVASRVSAGEFQQDMNEIEAWVRSQGGKVTQTRLYHGMRNMVKKDPRELDNRLSFLVSSGRLNRNDSGKGVIYELNGSATPF